MNEHTCISKEHLKGLLLRDITKLMFRPEEIRDKEQFLDDVDYILDLI